MHQPIDEDYPLYKSNFYCQKCYKKFTGDVLNTESKFFGDYAKCLRKLGLILCAGCSHWIVQYMLRDEGTVIIERENERNHYQFDAKNPFLTKKQFGIGYGGEIFAINKDDSVVVT